MNNIDLNNNTLKEHPEQLYDDRTKILFFAQDKFFRDGFYKISMDEIARELQMSKSTLYKHFPSKTDIVRESILSLASGVRENITSIIASEKNAVEKFLSIIKILTETITRFSDKWMSDLQHHAPDVWIQIDTLRKKLMYENISKIIIQGQKEGSIHKYPPEIIITTFTGAIRAVVNPQFLINVRMSYNDAVQYSFKILLNGMLTEKGKNILNNISK